VAALPVQQHATVQAIYALHAKRRAAEPPRGYLGWSEIGHECSRYLWLSWRWASFETFEGRIVRLFETGNREEARVLDELREIGCTVWDRDENGKQFSIVSHKGHMQGHLDAVVQGLPEAPKTAHLVDVKTINTKRMTELQKKGMKTVYPKYWAQAHGYMSHYKLARALFIFVCKDDDTLFVERIEYDDAEFRRFESRAAAILDAKEPPEKFDAESFTCKFCHFKSQCHGTEAALPNCRTCAHSTPVADGNWMCEWWENIIPFAAQVKGCAEHRYIPALVSSFAELVEYNTISNEAVWRNKLTDKKFTQPRYSSMEMHQTEGKAALGEAFVESVKDEFLGMRCGFKEFPSDLPWADDQKKAPKGGIDHKPLGELYRTTEE